MVDQVDQEYYVSRIPELLRRFDEESGNWSLAIDSRFGNEFAEAILRAARELFDGLIPQIPYIGGDGNHLTGSLIGSVRCLAFYKAMRSHGKTAQETGKLLYDAVLARIHEPLITIPPSERLTTEQLMERRRKRAERSQERRYSQDYVYSLSLATGKRLITAMIFPNARLRSSTTLRVQMSLCLSTAIWISP